MRLLLLVLAIVLLPLRGWVGDAMMLAPTQQAMGGHAMHEMHDMHAMLDAGHGTDSSEAAPAAHTACDTCQFCHSIAVTAWPEVPMPFDAPAQQPAAEAVRFVSAEAVPGFKPPIS